MTRRAETFVNIAAEVITVLALALAAVLLGGAWFLGWGS